MNDIYKISKEPLKATIDNLKMFEQTQYCFRYIKSKMTEKEDEKIKYNAEIAAACFRQANEYYKAASSVSLSTSPLLYSYALNNILKGTCYLKTFDNDIISGFKSHGFKVNDSDIGKNILKSEIQIFENGAVSSLLKLFNNSLDKQKIEFNKIIRHIPGIEDTYFKTTGVISLIALNDKNDKSEYVINGEVLTEEIKEIMEEFGLIGNIAGRNQCIYCYMNILGKSKIKDGIYSENNIFYRNYLNIPKKFIKGIKDINIAFYCYLLIMFYGMLVRYNAHKWEKFIDKKDSKEATLIELSLIHAVNNFYYQIHKILFDYYYDSDIYSDLDVKRVIKNSTKDIMNNINNEIKHHNLQYNSQDLLPWSENYR